MNIKADYHTHSTYSKWYHARHSINQMAKAAKELGLTELAITDHGPKHLLFGVNIKKLDKAINQSKKASEQHGIKVYYGIEANLTGLDGSIDLTADQIAKLDILLMGYHKGTKCDFIRYFFNKKRNSPEQIEKNTQAYVNAIHKHNIAIVTHINEYIKVDVAQVAKACAETNTLIEFNRKHLKFTQQEAQALIDSGANFVLSSDAHKKSRIADVARCIEFIEKYNIPKERVLNLQDIVNFKKPTTQEN